MNQPMHQCIVCGYPMSIPRNCDVLCGPCRRLAKHGPYTTGVVLMRRLIVELRNRKRGSNRAQPKWVRPNMPEARRARTTTKIVDSQAVALDVMRCPVCKAPVKIAATLCAACSRFAGAPLGKPPGGAK